VRALKESDLAQPGPVPAGEDVPAASPGVPRALEVTSEIALTLALHLAAALAVVLALAGLGLD
jgi:hypothetical protein